MSRSKHSRGDVARAQAIRQRRRARIPVVRDAVQAATETAAAATVPSPSRRNYKKEAKND